MICSAPVVVNTNEIPTVDFVVRNDAGTYKTVSSLGRGYYEDTDIHNLFSKIKTDHAPDVHIHLLPGSYTYSSQLQITEGDDRFRVTGSGIHNTLIEAAGNIDIDAIKFGPVDSQTLSPQFENLKYDGSQNENNSGSRLVEDTSGTELVTDAHFEHVYTGCSFCPEDKPKG
jgi:hypothetical protein